MKVKIQFTKSKERSKIQRPENPPIHPSERKGETKDDNKEKYEYEGIERRARVCRPANGSVICVRTVMGKATDANGGCFAMKLSCRIKGRERGGWQRLACNRRHKLTIVQTTAAPLHRISLPFRSSLVPNSAIPLCSLQRPDRNSYSPSRSRPPLSRFRITIPPPRGGITRTFPAIGLRRALSRWVGYGFALWLYFCDYIY